MKYGLVMIWIVGLSGALLADEGGAREQSSADLQEYQ